MILFCHLLNDHSGCPMVLRSTLDALNSGRQGLLSGGSRWPGVPTRRDWYRRNGYRPVPLVTCFASQLALCRARSRVIDIPRDAAVFVDRLLPTAAMLRGWRSGRRVVFIARGVSSTPGKLRRFLTAGAARSADLPLSVSKALRVRLPNIDPPVGGPAEIVIHGTEGYGIDSYEGAALGQAVLKLFDDPETCGPMVRAARIRARDFSFDAYFAALRDVFGSLGRGRTA